MRCARPPARLAVSLALGLLLFAACRHTPAGGGGSASAAVSGSVPDTAYYEAGGVVPAALTNELIDLRPHLEFRRIEIPARVPASLTRVPRAQDPIEILWMQPRPLSTDARPLVLISPILNNKLTLMNELGTGFVRQGYSVAILPRKEMEFDARRSLVEAEAESRLVIMRARQALDWLVARPEIDAERVGAFGVSAGGIVAASMLGADPRIKAGVLVFAGAPMADVFVGSSEDRVRESIDQAQRELGWTRAQIRQVLYENLRTDPIVLAPRVDSSRVLMFIATKDDSVPTATQRRLWEALGRPEKYELSAGHYTGFALFLPFIAHKSQRFLARHLGTP